ncbi:MAG: Rieske 2Fe-2S domain-containing protein [Bradymonadaceae bacterium]|nr:Rieske 2Fe-2S domain-containing protein [Lujinxingiaceae bacterium]
MGDAQEQLIEQGFELACRVDEVPVIMPKRVEVHGRGVLICKADEGFFAVDEYCPHKYKSMAMGIVFDGQINCPWHGYVFDLETGRCKSGKRCAPVTTYEVQVVDAYIWVRA